MFTNINLNKYSPFSFIEYGFQAYYAYVFFMVWTHPELHPVSLINDLAVLMTFEFIMVHSGVFMAIMPKKWSLFIFFPLYGTFAYSFNESVINTNILFIYLLTVLNRMRFAFSNVTPDVRMKQIGKSVVKVIFYFFLIMILAIGNEYVPPFGLTNEFLEKSHYFQMVKSGGLFIEKPYVPICMGFIYYSLPVLYFVYRKIKNFGKEEIPQKGKLVFSRTTVKSNKF